MTISKIQVLAFSLAAMACLLISIPSFAGSQVRIVRLSDVEGVVQINRNTAHVYEKAFLNLPVVQGNEVRTLNDGRAVVEFENGIALRMAPDTTAEFSQLSLDDSGNRLSNVRLHAGELYVEFNDPKNDRLTINFENEKIVFTQPTHLRIDIGYENATVAVFSGQAEVEAPSGTVQVSKNRTALFSLVGNDANKVARGIEPDLNDAWDKQQERYQQRYSNDLAANSSPYSYGLTDLSYYGTYFNAPGYGLMWQPYFAGAGWNPFMDGAWAFYPGAGYGWVSAYPWGWTPYHSGSWAFIPNRGWAWQPGGTWMAVSTYPRVLNAPPNFVAPRPPVAAAQSIVVVSRDPSSFSGKSASRIVIRNDSAGLGIPRGGVNNLSHISERVGTQGAVTATIHAAPVQTETRTSALQTWPGSVSGSGNLSSPQYPTGQGNVGAMHSGGSAAHSAPAGRSSKN